MRMVYVYGSEISKALNITGGLKTMMETKESFVTFLTNEGISDIKEFFGGKSYYRGPHFDKSLNIPGTYYVYFWDPDQKGGDYVAVLGRKEGWRFRDIIQAFRNTTLIRMNKELHINCSESAIENWHELDTINH
jgi:hypothetical protein